MKKRTAYRREAEVALFHQGDMFVNPTIIALHYSRNKEEMLDFER
jgi:hypothetical protein